MRNDLCSEWHACCMFSDAVDNMLNSLSTAASTSASLSTTRNLTAAVYFRRLGGLVNKNTPIYEPFWVAPWGPLPGMGCLKVHI